MQINELMMSKLVLACWHFKIENFHFSFIVVNGYFIVLTALVNTN